MSGSVSQDRSLAFAAGLASGVVIVGALLAARRRTEDKAEDVQESPFSADRKQSRKKQQAARGPLRPYEHEALMQKRINPISPRVDLSKVQRTPSFGVDAGAREEIREEVIKEHAIERQKVTVRVPATSANLGPGFDCLGLALGIWSEVTVSRSDKFEIIYEGEGKEDVPTDESNLLVTGAKAAFAAAGKPLPLLRYHCVNRIPYARGMGSSSAAIVAGLIAGLVLAGHKLPCWGAEALLQLACNIEGHPDNVAPVVYGGCQLGIHNGERWQTERVHLPPGMQVVLFIPNFTGKTSDARRVLPDMLSRQDAVFTIGRVAWLINALVTGNVMNLRAGCEDKLHQPPRAKSVYPYLDPVIKAACDAGACCAYLSGAGPTVAALVTGASGDIFTQREAERVDKQVAQAMVEAANLVGVKGKVYITTTSETGAHVVSADPEFSGGTIKYQGDV